MINYLKTFTYVPKLYTVGILFLLLVNLEWDLYQLDTKNAFFNGDLQEKVLMDTPSRFINNTNKHKVCKLENSSYGVKQSPEHGLGNLQRFSLCMGSKQAHSEHTLFIKGTVTDNITILIVYANVIILPEHDLHGINRTKKQLAKEFELKDLGKLNYFLRIKVGRTQYGMSIAQRKYVLELLHETCMLGCKPAVTPSVINHKINGIKHMLID